MTADTHAPLSDADVARLAVEGCSYPDEREVAWLALEVRRLRAENGALRRDLEEAVTGWDRAASMRLGGAEGDAARDKIRGRYGL